MDSTTHPLSALFAQLGLADDAVNIAAFLAAHAGLAEDITLADAPFWTPTQATFLREEILEDADWAEVIDELNLRLRKG